ncbi:MAG TPA: glycosyltransferase family 25 protein [Thermoanaerobaculia bacterium]|nr:glycosyltransferase family 25 protein [Thermoanaerobaculia bacterium]
MTASGGVLAGDLVRDFPHRICINLDRRPERWRRMQGRFARLGLDPVERSPAIDGGRIALPPGWPGRPGAYGCLLSHLGVVERARKLGWSRVLIFEDDVLFSDRLHEEYSAAVAGLPDDWEVLYFGCLHREHPVPVAPGLARLTSSFSTYAYALRNTVYDAYVEVNTAGSLEPLDGNNLVLQKLGRCYCFLPHLAWVEEGYSDVQDREVNHWWLQESLVLNGPEMERLVASSAVVVPWSAQTAGSESPRNLRFLLEYLHLRVRGLEVVILEADGAPPLERELPPNARRERMAGRGDRAGCYREALRRLAASREIFLFAEPDVWLQAADLRAGLLKLRDYQVVSAPRQLVELSAEDSRHLRKDEWFDLSSYAPQLRAGLFGAWCGIRREALEALSGWDEEALEREARRGLLTVFESPSSAAFRLFAGAHATIRACNSLESAP